MTKTIEEEIMIESLQIRIRQGRTGKAFVVVDNFPGLHAEMTCKQLHQMAEELKAAADLCDSFNTTNSGSFNPP